jgi:hypothetical protein
MKKYVCANAGFRVTDPQEYAKCQTTIADYVEYLYDGAVTVSLAIYLRQTYMAQTFNAVLQSNNPDLPLQVLANRNTLTSALGVGLMANEWLPVVRAVVTAVAIALAPLVVIFFPTPIVGRAVGVLAGLFIWLVSWGITDALTFSLAVEYGHSVFEQIRQNSLGLAAILYTPDGTIKALGMFGILRSTGILLATVLSQMLVKFGGYALAMIAGNLSGMVHAQRASAAMQTQTPEGVTHLLESQEEAPPVMANAHRVPYTERVQGRAWHIFTQTQTARGFLRAQGGRVAEAAEAMAQATTVSNMRSVGRAQQLTTTQSAKLGALEGAVDQQRVETQTVADAQQIGRIAALEQRYQAWQHAAQQLVDRGLTSTLAEGMEIVTFLAQAQRSGQAVVTRDVAEALLGKHLGLSSPQMQAFRQHLAQGNMETLTHNPSFRNALSRLVDTPAESLTAADLSRVRAALQHQEHLAFQQATAAMTQLAYEQQAGESAYLEQFKHATGLTSNREAFQAMAGARTRYASAEGVEQPVISPDGTVRQWRKEGIVTTDNAQQLREAAQRSQFAHIVPFIQEGMAYEALYGPGGALVNLRLTREGQAVQIDVARRTAGTEQREFAIQERRRERIDSAHTMWSREETGVVTAQNLSTLQALAQQAGLSHVATHLAEGMVYTLRRSPGGQIADIQLTGGGTVQHRDMVQTQSGQETQEKDLTRIEHGVREEVGYTSQFAFGPQLQPGTAMNLVQTRELAWLGTRGELRSLETSAGQGRFTENFAHTLHQWVNNRISEEEAGRIAAALGFHIPGTGIGGGVNFGKQWLHTEVYDRITYQSKAIFEASTRGGKVDWLAVQEGHQWLIEQYQTDGAQAVKRNAHDIYSLIRNPSSPPTSSFPWLAPERSQLPGATPPESGSSRKHSTPLSSSPISVQDSPFLEELKSKKPAPQ